METATVDYVLHFSVDCCSHSAFLVERFPVARSRHVGIQELLLESGIIDSLGVLEVVAYLEREFSIDVSDDDLTPTNFRSIESLASFVAAKLDTGKD